MLRAQNEQLKDQLKQSKSEVDKIIQQNLDMRIARSPEPGATLQSERDTLLKQNQVLQQKNQMLEAKINSMVKEVDQHNARIITPQKPDDVVMVQPFQFPQPTIQLAQQAQQHQQAQPVQQLAQPSQPLEQSTRSKKPIFDSAQPAQQYLTVQQPAPQLLNRSFQSPEQKF